MAQLKSRGFVSNIYVFVHLIISISFTIFIAIVLAFLEERRYLFFPLFIPFFIGMLLFISFYKQAPAAYKRFEINSQGVKCGKQFVRYENVEKITVRRGCVLEQWGFSFIEKHTGAKQHNELYLEAVICINCDYEGYTSKKSKQSIYIPMTRKTDALLSAYCESYKQLSNASKPSFEEVANLKTKPSPFQIVCLLVLDFLLCGILALLTANGVLSLYKAVIIALLGILCFALLGLKENIISSLAFNLSEFRNRLLGG